MEINPYASLQKMTAMQGAGNKLNERLLSSRSSMSAAAGSQSNVNVYTQLLTSLFKYIVKHSWVHLWVALRQTQLRLKVGAAHWLGEDVAGNWWTALQHFKCPSLHVAWVLSAQSKLTLPKGQGTHSLMTRSYNSILPENKTSLYSTEKARNKRKERWLFQPPFSKYPYGQQTVVVKESSFILDFYSRLKTSQFFFSRKFPTFQD